MKKQTTDFLYNYTKKIKYISLFLLLSSFFIESLGCSKLTNNSDSLVN
ncbi:hypothetical protein HOG98_06990 [bacterium]|nr:hypothetical protein [bacterium]